MSARSEKFYKDQADKILKQAQKDGVLDNFLFVTTFDRYMDKIHHLQALEEELEVSGYTVEKTYNGSTNEVASPAYRNYIALCDSLDRTVSTLIKVTKEFKKGSASGSDPLSEFLDD